MTRWFRLESSGSPGESSRLPPTPGGGGGSGFYGVGGALPGSGRPGAAGEHHDIDAGRRRTSRTIRGQEEPTSAQPSSGPRRALLRRLVPARGASGTTEERRFAQVYAEDRLGPMPYPNQAVPDVALARERVRALVSDLLPDGIDGGTGAAFDPLIASWTAGWLARIDSEHADHHAVVDRLVGGARGQLAAAEAAHERDRRALEIARADYMRARESLIDPIGVNPPQEGGRSGPSMPVRLCERLSLRSQPPRGVPEGRHDRQHTDAAQARTGRDLHDPEPATRPTWIPPATYGRTVQPHLDSRDRTTAPSRWTPPSRREDDR